MRIKNYCPHELVIFDHDKHHIATIPSRGSLRVQLQAETMGHTQSGIPLQKTRRTYVDPLPDYEPGTIIVVSNLYFRSVNLRERHDVYRPGKPIKDATNKQIGCIGLTR